MSVSTLKTTVVEILKDAEFAHRIRRAKNLKYRDWKRGRKGNVVFIHGWRGCKSFWCDAGNYINSKGFKVHFIDELADNTFPLTKSASVVEKYLVEHDLREVIVISHSKGGLISKYLLDNSSESWRIKKLITVATPFNGTLWGMLLVKSLHEMLWQSPILKKLRANKINNKNIINIFPKVDDHVIPTNSCLLSGAQNIELDFVGHTRIMNAPEMRKLLDKQLAG